MRHLNRFTVLCVAVLLLAAPSAFACGELGAMLTSPCPMAEMSQSRSTSPCHDANQMAEDCCDIQSVPESMQALSFESVKLLVSLEVTDLQVVAPLALAALPHATPADAFRLHDLGRYTLFSSFLL